ncbi:MAG: sodium-dependent transporter [Pseudomonadota bacterium]
MARPGQWSSQFTFLMAAVGFAVGLGNIWRFPYVTGENGGAAFILIYLICVVAIGVPILMAELMLGRSGGGSPPGALATLSRASGRSPAWAGIGYLNLATAALIVVGYTVVAGWVLAYLFQALQGGVLFTEGVAATQAFDDLLDSFPALLGWGALSLALTCTILYAGLQSGIERAVRILMPTLFGLLVALALYNVFFAEFGSALAYLFTPDFDQVTADTVLAAIGQAFFSIGVAMAGMMVFGAYLPKDVSIVRSAAIIVVADTSVAILAGLVIFPMVFAAGLDPQGGPGLIFSTLPVAFANIPGGAFLAAVFFLLLAVAAVTSLVGLCEPLCAWMIERFEITRSRAAITLGALMLPGLALSALSYNNLADVRLGGYSLEFLIDFVPNQIMLPLGGLLLALFAGWVLQRSRAVEGLGLGAQGLFGVWHFLVKFFLPLAIGVVLISGIAG